MNDREFLEFLRTCPEDGLGKREELVKYFLKIYNAPNLKRAYENSGLQEKTTGVSFFAGKGTRWDESIQQSPDCKIDPDKPRCLAMVPNLLFPSSDEIPIGAYNSNAINGLGDYLIIYKTYPEEIEKKILSPLEIKAQMFEQQILPGKQKVSGHGDALRQAKHLIQDSE